MTSNKSFMISAALLAITGLLLVVYGVIFKLNTSVILTWETATEFETAGYMINRSENAEGPFEQITAEMLPASTDPLTGGVYKYTDTGVTPGKTYYYQLEEIENSGTRNIEGPVEATATIRGTAEIILGSVLLAFAWFTFRIGKKQPVAIEE